MAGLQAVFGIQLYQLCSGKRGASGGDSGEGTQPAADKQAADQDASATGKEDKLATGGDGNTSTATQ